MSVCWNDWRDYDVFTVTLTMHKTSKTDMNSRHNTQAQLDGVK